MSEIKLKRIEAEAFRSFVDPTTIDFPESGLVLINGKNKETGGSSGSGKSSVVLSIAFGFDYCPFAATNLQSFSHLTDKKLKLRYLVDVDGVEYSWIKGEWPSFYKSGHREASNASGTSSKVTELIGLDPKVLAALTYRSQRSFGTFLGLGDTEKKEFLNKVLKLDIIEEAVEASELNTIKLQEQLLLITTEYNVKKQFLESLMIYVPNIQSNDPSAINVAKLSFKNLREEGHIFEEKYKIAQAAELEELNMKVDAAKKEIPYFNQKINELVLKKNSTDELVKDVDGTRVLELTNQLNLEEQTLQTILDKKEEHRIVFFFRKQELDEKNKRYMEAINRCSELQKDKLILLCENKALEANACPTCNKQWENAESKAKINLIQISRIDEELIDNAKLIEDLKETEEELNSHIFERNPEIEKIQKRISDINVELGIEKQRIRSELDNKKSEIDSAINDYKLKIQQLESKAEQVKYEYLNSYRETTRLEKYIKEINEKSQALKADIDRIADRMKDIEKQNKEEHEKEKASLISYKKHKDNLEALNTTKNKLEAELALEKDFIKLVGKEGFLSAIFDEIIFEISEETNRILAEIPNTAKCSIHFKSEKTTQKGTVKKTITPMIHLNGTEGPYKSILSGGMIAALELAVDLAVSNVVSNRTGIRPGWLVLDESFEGLGLVEKEACLQILLNYAKDRLVLVIDHATEFKEMFNKVITVTYQNERSIVE